MSTFLSWWIMSEICRIFFLVFSKNHLTGLVILAHSVAFSALYFVFSVCLTSRVLFSPLSFLKRIKLCHLHRNTLLHFSLLQIGKFSDVSALSRQIDTTSEEWGRYPTFHLRMSLAVFIPFLLPTLRHILAASSLDCCNDACRWPTISSSTLSLTWSPVISPQAEIHQVFPSTLMSLALWSLAKVQRSWNGI